MQNIVPPEPSTTRKLLEAIGTMVGKACSKAALQRNNKDMTADYKLGYIAALTDIMELLNEEMKKI